MMLMEVGIPYCISILNIHGKLRTTFFWSCKVFIALVLCSFCSIFSGYFKSHSTDRMKKFKRRLSLTLRGSQTIDESLSELAEQMTIEENSSKDNGKYLGVGRGGKILYTFDYCVNGMKIYFPDQFLIASLCFSNLWDPSSQETGLHNFAFLLAYCSVPLLLQVFLLFHLSFHFYQFLNKNSLYS